MISTHLDDLGYIIEFAVKASEFIYRVQNKHSPKSLTFRSAKTSLALNFLPFNQGGETQDIERAVNSSRSLLSGAHLELN